MLCIFKCTCTILSLHKCLHLYKKKNQQMTKINIRSQPRFFYTRIYLFFFTLHVNIKVNLIFSTDFRLYKQSVYITIFLWNRYQTADHAHPPPPKNHLFLYKAGLLQWEVGVIYSVQYQHVYLPIQLNM